MSLSTTSVQRPVTVVVLYALVLGVAAAMIPRLAIDLYPDTSPPVISIITRFPGAGPEDVEANVTQPLERVLATVTGLRQMNSTSSLGSSSIILQFGYDMDMTEVRAEVESVVTAAAGRLPAGASAPIIRRFNLSQLPIMRLVIRGNYPLDDLRRLADERVQPALERIDGVSAAEATGGSSLSAHVAVRHNRLAAYNLTLSQVAGVLSGQNVLISGGSLVRGTTEFQIRTQNQLTSLDDLRRTVIRTTTAESAAGASGTNRTQVVRLEDIADISVRNRASDARIYLNDLPAINILVQRESGTNAVQVARSIRDALDAVNEDLPPGVTLEVLTDQTTLIQAVLNQVYTAAWQGALLAMAVLLLFLRNIKATFVVGLSMPISIAITLMAMSIFGLTLNLLTLTGLILGLGMIVDGSIVVIENIHNYRLRGAKAAVAATLGTHEMHRAIVASTATTLGVFVPLIVFNAQLEMIGRFSIDLVFTVVISLISSLIVALTLVPALAGPILHIETRAQKPLRLAPLRFIDDRIEGAFQLLDRAYRRAIHYVLGHRILIMTLVTLTLVYSVLQFEGMGLNLFVRSRTDDSVTVNLTMPVGTPVDETERVLRGVQDVVEAEVRGYRNLVLSAATGGGFGSLQITLPPPAQQIDTPASIQAKLQPVIISVPGAQFTIGAGRRMGGSSAVEVVVSSDNSQAGLDTAEQIRGIIERELPMIEDPTLSLSAGGPELAVVIDRDRAALFGVSVSAIANEIRLAMNGSNVTTMQYAGNTIDVELILRPEDRAALTDLDAVFVSGTGGRRIPLSSVARIVEGRAPSSITRENQRRLVRVSGDLPAGVAATEMQNVVRETVLASAIVPEGVEVSFAGEAQQIRQFGGSFAIIIAAAVVLVFGIMASQFESFVDPLIIFFSIPLLFIGVIWIYKLSAEPFSLFSAVGVVALVGIVVNNGIVLVDYTNLLRARGHGVHTATIEAGSSRLRPILMTSLTTVLGMVPLAFFPGAGAETIQPIGKTMVGGLTVSSIMTLFVTPAMYSLLNSRHDRRAARKKARAAARADDRAETQSAERAAGASVAAGAVGAPGAAGASALTAAKAPATGAAITAVPVVHTGNGSNGNGSHGAASHSNGSGGKQARRRGRESRTAR